MLLGVNIDHIAILREARQVGDPDILEAMYVAQNSGADQITIHLREDRRHICDNDAFNIVKHCKIPVNIECSIDPDIIGIISSIAPYRATLVPEKREELTTEGGLYMSLDVKKSIEHLKQNQISTSVFIDPNEENIVKASEYGADFVEFHTGVYANIYLMLYSNLAHTKYSIKNLQKTRNELTKSLNDELIKLANSAKLAHDLGLGVAAGHGLNYQNVLDIIKIKHITELNIGQSIVARSVFVGLSNAIKDMKRIVNEKTCY